MICTDNSVRQLNAALLKLKQTPASKEIEELRQELIADDEEILNPIDNSMYLFSKGQYLPDYGYDEYHNYTAPSSVQISQSWFTFGELMVIYGTVVDTWQGKPRLQLPVTSAVSTQIEFRQIACDAPQNFIGTPTSILTPNIPLNNLQLKLLYSNPVKYENDYLYYPVAKYAVQGNEGSGTLQEPYTTSFYSTMYCYSFALLGKVKD